MRTEEKSASEWNEKKTQEDGKMLPIVVDVNNWNNCIFYNFIISSGPSVSAIYPNSLSISRLTFRFNKCCQYTKTLHFLFSRLFFMIQLLIVFAF